MKKGNDVTNRQGELLWIEQKNQSPTYQREWPTRNRLDHLICGDKRHYQRIFIQAPAGYGKTELMRHWYELVEHKGWLTLDAKDSDPQRLIHHFLKACSDACQQPMTSCFEWLQQGNTEAALESALAILQHQSRLMYVFIDDIHLIAQTDAFTRLSTWLLPLANVLTLVLSSRQKMPFATAKRLLNKQDLLITSTQLALTPEEAQLSVQRYLKQPLDRTEACTSFTAGWPACFQLLCPALESVAIAHPLSGQATQPDDFYHAFLHQYLSEEVIAPLPLDLQTALCDLSLFDTLSPALLQSWPFTSNIESAIERLTEHHHLLSRTHNGQLEWPAVLKACLKRITKQKYSQAQQAENHRKAADILLALGDDPSALKHALASQDLNVLESLLNQHGWQLLNRGHGSLVEQALKQLPHEHILAQPEITVLKAWVHQGKSQFERVERCLLESEHYCLQHKINWSRAASGRYCALLAQIAMNRHQADKGKQLAKSALEQIPTDDYRSQMLATSVLGESNLVQGHLLRALSLTQQSERLARRHQGHQQVLWSMIQQNDIYLAQGRTQHAYQHQERLFQFIQDYHLAAHSLHEMVIRLRVKLLWHWGRFDDALAYCQAKSRGDEPCQAAHDLYRQALIAMIVHADPRKKDHLIDWDTLSDTLAMGDYHPDWVAQTSAALIAHWIDIGHQHALLDWQQNHPLPKTFYNHFDQLQARNHIRVLRFQGQLAQALHLTQQLIEVCQHHQLNFDRQLNQILLAALYVETGQTAQAQTVLTKALQGAQSSGIVTDFCLESPWLLDLLETLPTDNAHFPWPKQHLQQIKKAMQQHHHADQEQPRPLFAPSFIEQLMTCDGELPEFIRTSPLTPREWQVLGFIWLGFSNEDIAEKMDVAYTTVKSHIRNLYQKLAVSSRKQAKQKAQALLDLMH